MNPENPRTPREELETRLTALLMGALPLEEAAALQTQIAADPELAELHGRLRKAVELLREASALPEQPPPPAPVQLSSERRGRLLAHFKTPVNAPRPAPTPIVKMRRQDWSWVAPIGIAAALIALIGIGVTLPVYSTGRKRSQATRILEDLREIDSTIDHYAIANNSAQPFATPAPGVAMLDDASKLSWQSQPGMLHKKTLGLAGMDNQAPPASPGSSANETTAHHWSFNDAKATPPPMALVKAGSGTYVLNPVTDAPAPPPVATAAPSKIDRLSMTTDGGTLDLNGVNRSAGDLQSGGAGQAPGIAAPGKDSLANRSFATGVPVDTSEYRVWKEDQKPLFFGDASVNGLALNGVNSYSGNTTLSGGSTFTGGTTINAGTLSITNANKGTFPMTPTTPTAFETRGTDGTSFGGVIGSGGITQTGAGVVTLGSNSKNSESLSVDSIPALKTPAPIELTAGATVTVPSVSDSGNLNITSSGVLTASSGGTITLPRGAVDIQQKNLKDLSFDWALGETRVSGDKFAGGIDGPPNAPAPRPIDPSGAPVRANDKKEELAKRMETPEPEREVLARRDRAKKSPSGGFMDAEKAGADKPALALKETESAELKSDKDNIAGRLNVAKQQLNEQVAAASDETRAKAVAKSDVAFAKPIRKSAVDEDADKRRPAASPAAKPVEMAKLKANIDSKITNLKRELNEPETPAQPKAPATAAIPQPEVPTSTNAFSTFSLNVSDVSFKLAAASLEQSRMPEPSTVRSEEFVNAFDYRDPEPAPGAPLAFAAERARYPFAQNRDLLRFSVKTAAAGRQPGRALNIVLLLDNSGSMERADRVNIVREALRVLASQLQPQDKLSIVTFARAPRLWADGVAGDKAGEMLGRVSEITPEGGTNLEAALDLGYATALRHYAVGSISRVVLFTDGAANLGDVNPDALKKKVEEHRKKGVALDCFGIGWEGYNDDLLEQLTRNGDGRYGFINTPEEAAANFATQLAGALRVAASDVKVQVEFNPRRVTAYRQIGYAKHQLTKEQFRDNTVDAAEIGAAESGNALYVVEVDPRGEGNLATVRVRFRIPGTSDYREHEWAVPFTGNAQPLEEASPALRLAGTASAFSELLAGSPYAAEVTDNRLLGLLNGVPGIYGADPRPMKLEWMIRQALSLSGR